MAGAAIGVARAKTLTVRQEIALLETAVRAHPNAGAIRFKLAQLLVLDDRFDDALAMLPDAADDGYAQAMLRFQAHVSRETAVDDRSAARAAARAIELARGPGEEASARADLAKAQRRLGALDGAESNLRAALDLDPHQVDACKRLAALLLARGDAGALLTLARDLAARGASHAWLFAAQTIAHCRLGDGGAARALAGLDSLRIEARLQPPEWTSIEAFNTALVDEVMAHPALRFERYGTASCDTWRVDEPLVGDTPAIAALHRAIADAVQQAIGDLADRDHPWLRARPAACRLSGSCVITQGTGYERWHIHQKAWMSGVYYAAVPARVQSGNDAAGCLAFGMDDALAGEAGAEAFGTRWLRPQPGVVTAFPSHLHHRTFAHETPERRVAFAFDICAV